MLQWQDDESTRRIEARRDMMLLYAAPNSAGGEEVDACPRPASGFGAIAAERNLGAAMAGDSPSHATKRVTVEPLVQLHRRHHCRSDGAKWCTTGTTKRASATGCMWRRSRVWTRSSRTGR
jgi:hypothetical protein